MLQVHYSFKLWLLLSHLIYIYSSTFLYFYIPIFTTFLPPSLTTSNIHSLTPVITSFITPFHAIFNSFYLYSYTPSITLRSLLVYIFLLFTTLSSRAHFSVPNAILQHYLSLSFEVLTVLAGHPVAGASATTEGMCLIQAVKLFYCYYANNK